MTKYYDNGDSIIPREERDDGLDKMPAEIYALTVTETPMSIHISFRKSGKHYPLPRRLYGDVNTNCKTIFDDYVENGTTGVILTGLKGSGKSTTANKLGNMMLKHGLPVLEIKDKHNLLVLENSLMMIGSCMVLFDEFEKHYDVDDQNRLLELFSNKRFKKYLFVVCANRGDKLTDYIINRPGRFRYRIEFGAISRKDIMEIAAHHNINNKHLIGAMHFYANEKRISADIMENIFSKMSNNDTLADLHHRYKIMNMPDTPSFCVSSLSVAYADSRYDEVHANVDDHILHIELQASEDRSLPPVMASVDLTKYEEGNNKTIHTDSGVDVHINMDYAEDPRDKDGAIYWLSYECNYIFNRLSNKYNKAALAGVAEEIKKIAKPTPDEEENTAEPKPETDKMGADFRKLVEQMCELQGLPGRGFSVKRVDN